MGVARPLTVAILIPRHSQLFGPVAAGAILCVFWLGMLASLRGTSQTYDEGVHLTAGYTYWRYNDYRLNPENGNLPQRVVALPLLLGKHKFPPADGEAWRASQEWDLTWKWFYELGNDVDAMTLLGRAAGGLVAIALGVLVWRWSRQLFGPVGGMLSLLLFVLNPSILANGALMTSDTASAFFFLATMWSWWRMLQRLTFVRLIVSALAMGGLFVSKMSAALIVPMAVAMVVARLIDGRPLSVPGFGECRGRAAQLLAFSAAAFAHVAIVLIVIWGCNGFRYAAFSPKLPGGTWTQTTWETVLYKPVPRALLDQLDLTSTEQEKVKEIFSREKAEQDAWPFASVTALEAVKREVLTKEQAARLAQLWAEPSPRLIARVIETLRHYHLLPEAYIYGFAHVWCFSRERAAFFNGDFSMSGWPGFFPYTFLVKTPLSIFVVILLAIGAAFICRRGSREEARGHGIYETVPLWVLLGFYWVAAISSHLNIGHRHILPTYPPLFILCGAAASWFGIARLGRDESAAAGRGLMRAAQTVLAVAILFLAIEVCYRFPHYLAYFNGIVRPTQAYRHLVYSSLDWGQDLPGVRRYIEMRKPAPPVYLSYFGFASPIYYRVPAIYTYSVTGRYLTPALQTLVFPAEQAETRLTDFLQRAPEYDEQLIGRARRDDEVFAVVVKKSAALRLTAGTYFISATLLQPTQDPRRGALGPWNERLEKQYQTARQLIGPLLSDEPAERRHALTQAPPEKWLSAMSNYEFLRFHRLAAFLRQREPDDNVGFSILVYRISDDELARALEGPPAELGRDILQELFGQPR